MDYTSIFTLMRAEVTLTAILVFVFLYDLMAGERARRRFSAVVCCLMVVQVVVNLVPAAGGELFGGMFCHTPMDGIVKSMLSVGALIVFLQSDTWLRREDTRHKQGEFYILTLSTLLGMYFMIGAGNFLLFFIGLELASVPMACLVAFDKYKRYSAEAGAKYILCALFSSGLMLYGISFLYGTTGTLYFGDMAARIDGSPLQVMALVFFLSGLGFKISLVPFHLWTADAYQGAPTNVTAYLSVVSKGAAAFVLLTVLVKVFAPMTEQWQTLLWIVTVSSITVANHPLRRNPHLRTYRHADRPQQIVPRRRHGQQPQPHRHRHSLPPRPGLRRQAHGLRRRARHQGTAARPGKAAITHPGGRPANPNRTRTKKCGARSPAPRICISRRVKARTQRR